MENQHLANCKDTFLHIASEAIKICRTYEKHSPELKNLADHFEENLQERLNDFNPKIMVYGIYNSGKSTIMNALMGQKKAAMSDVPTTTTIDEYQWKEYTIFDTPGINAPKKDEEVSKAQLGKCDVILFVMDTEGAFNLGKNYQELIDIIQSGKRLLIVLNNKSGFDPSDPKDAQEIQKITRNIYSDFAELYGKVSPDELAQKVKIILVNALDALNARTDNSYSDAEKEILLNASNITALEDAIISEYGRASGFTILHELEIQLNKNLDQLSKILTGLSGDQLTIQGNQTLCELQDLQEQLITKISDYAHDTADELDGDIYSILTHEKEEDEAKKKIETAANEWAQRVNRFMGEQIKNIANRVDSVIADFTEAMKVTVGEVHTSPETAELAVGNNLVAVPADGSNSIPTLDAAQGYLLQKGAKAILPVITKLPWIGPVVGKVLAPLVPVIGPIILVASILLPFFGKSDREKQHEAEMEAARRQEEAMRRQQEEIARRKQEVKEESQRISRKLVSGIIDEIRKMIYGCFEPKLKAVQSSVEKHRNDSSTAIADLRVINSLKQQLKEKVSVFCN